MNYIEISKIHEGINTEKRKPIYIGILKTIH